MSRRLVARTMRLNSGLHACVYVDMDANAAVVTLARNGVEIAEISVPGGLLPPVLDGLQTARIELNRKVRPRAQSVA